MRKKGIRCLEILHAFLLLSGVYQGLAVLIDVYDQNFFYKSFLLLPFVAILSVAVRRVTHVLPYFGITLLVEIGIWVLTVSGFERNWMSICVIAASIYYFVARATKKKCWLEEPAYPWLLYFLLFYLGGYRVNQQWAMQVASMEAGVYFLICMLHTNLCEVEQFVVTHSNLDRLPVKRIGKINQWMIGSFSVILAVTMFSAPYLGIENIVKAIGAAFQMVVHWLLSFLPDDAVEMGGIAVETVQELPKMEAAKELSLFWIIFYKLLDLLGWLVAISLVVWFIVWVFRQLYRLYQRFNDTIEENGDRIERIQSNAKEIKRKQLERRKTDALFWDRSNNGRIRKHYKKRILHDWKEIPEGGSTPRKLNEGTTLGEEQKELFLHYYEKARYGKEPCSKDERNAMLKIK